MEMSSTELRYSEDNCHASYGDEPGIKYHPVKSRCVNQNVKKKYFCDNCNASYAFKSSLRYHLTKGRCIAAKLKVKKYICEDCNVSYNNRTALWYHRTKGRCIGLLNPDAVTYCFENNADFLSWKDEEERSSCSKFSQSNGSWITKRAKKIKYICHRAGNTRLKDLNSRKRPLKKKGSCKINSHCTAFMLYEEQNDGTITVLYNKNHCNHYVEMKHLPFSVCNQAIRDRHNEGMKIPVADIEVMDNGIAFVKSQSNRFVCYAVGKRQDQCDCQLRCADCDSVCVHQYECTCIDKSITSHFCKHIHAVLKFRKCVEIVSIGDLMSMDTPVENEAQSVEVRSICSQIQNNCQNLRSEKKESRKDELKLLAHQLMITIQETEYDEQEDDEMLEKACRYLKIANELLQSREKKNSSSNLQKNTKLPPNKKLDVVSTKK